MLVPPVTSAACEQLPLLPEPNGLHVRERLEGHLLQNILDLAVAGAVPPAVVGVAYAMSGTGDGGGVGLVIG